MQPQHVAHQRCSDDGPVALWTQTERVLDAGCIFRATYARLKTGRAKVAETLNEGSGGPHGLVGIERAVRRHRCQRASRFWRWSVCSPSLPPATCRDRKSSLSSSRNQFQSSQRIRANTTDLSAGPATRPVPHPSFQRPFPEARSC